MKPELIIFDWDGTLADTTRPIIRTFQQSFADCGLKAPDADAIRALIGYSLPEIIFRLAPDAGEHLREELAETYAAHYLNPNNHNMTLFPEAIPCLNTLKQQGFWLAVATGKGRTGLDRSIMQTGTADFWMATACASEYASKPAPDMVFALCSELGLEPSQTLIVGDTTHDLDMAANAKAPAVAVPTGAHTAAQLATRPHLAILNDLSELPGFIARL
ncbi:HAD-IA family hydrolase [Neisseria flava]|jgi:HAD hydrolase, family IA, variant 1|nr:HAD-IA family hydrolase [Neisseria sicca]AVR80049.1 HAD family hydrolase [Neisseria mucosa]MBY6283983.1 HAD-IA family hydrolase [Neisseria flava]OFJ80498.1 HAD family hydrolase [Neisseria sp. HMSC072F04]OFM96188.1 HAD family hydrolase [Neisseria sp. HMSC055F11]OFN32867.1 HAD family hydrolase [Neisseria sp. HMSC059F02]OFR10829.1 HAD family hydrolase [Neisseria sp. HMSC055H02]OHR37714.1 HAD family hydrolase [Neisseria sp. HMSC064F04]OHR40775.1 HAD family hydrolase [Neisseria sp. HMSC070E12